MSVAALHPGSESSTTPTVPPGLERDEPGQGSGPEQAASTAVPRPETPPEAQAGSEVHPTAETRPGSETEPLDPRLTHLLRLALDLQLDAMLFTLGVAATQDLSPESAVETIDLSAPVPSAVSGTEASTPWRRWTTEDLERTRRLASTAAEHGVALPPTLGRADRHADRRRAAEDLIARYEFMANLLGDLLDRAAGGTPSALVEAVQDALWLTHSRLIELRSA